MPPLIISGCCEPFGNLEPPGDWDLSSAPLYCTSDNLFYNACPININRRMNVTFRLLGSLRLVKLGEWTYRSLWLLLLLHYTLDILMWSSTRSKVVSKLLNTVARCLTLLSTVQIVSTHAIVPWLYLRLLNGMRWFYQPLLRYWVTFSSLGTLGFGISHFETSMVHDLNLIVVNITLDYFINVLDNLLSILVWQSNWTSTIEELLLLLLQ
jgi:hypothetical protein